jgi:hypothetical protein
MITAVIGTTSSASPASTVLRPSTADSTEIAGVIMLSPRNSEAPKMPNDASTTSRRVFDFADHCRSSVMRAMIPPSPWLFTRMTSPT